MIILKKDVPINTKIEVQEYFIKKDSRGYRLCAKTTLGDIYEVNTPLSYQETKNSLRWVQNNATFKFLIKGAYGWTGSLN